MRNVAVCLTLCLVLASIAAPYRVVVLADPVVPPVWPIVTEDFESGSLGAWTRVSEGDLRLVRGGGRGGSTGLSVVVGRHESSLYQAGFARAEEGYLEFWFDPNGVVIPDRFTWWPPGNSLCVASVFGGSWWPPLVSLYVRGSEAEGYTGYLAWPKSDGVHYDHESGTFDLVNGWQKITLGYRMDEWVAVWLNGRLLRHDDATVVHDDPHGEIIEIGKTNENSEITPNGSIRFDDVTFYVPRVDELWVDAYQGDDENDGLTARTAFRTIQKAADLAGPGTTVHVLPGVYRETVWPAMSGSVTEPSRYVAEHGPGTAILRGSEPSSVLTWRQLAANAIGLPPGVHPADIYYADLSTWELDGSPRFVVQLDGSGEVVARLPLAREPDWQAATDWKHHEFWWAADGGSAVAGCDPATNANPDCDQNQRSQTQLTDRSNDRQPAGIEPGNLTTLGNLTGATLVALDTKQGHYVYRRSIAGHDVSAGRVTVDRVCEHDEGSGDPGLGWGSKYYVEGKPGLLDTPGEWWYDASSGRLYLWPRTPGNPAAMNIEISRRADGFRLRNRSYITLDGLTVEFLNGSAVYLSNWTQHQSHGNTIRNAVLRYANVGVYLQQGVVAGSPSGNAIDGFTVQGCEIAHMDTHAIHVSDWQESGGGADAYIRSGVLNTVLRDNEMHHLGFRSDGDNAVGASFILANKLRIEGNHVHHVAHNGFQISQSVIQSPREYGFRPDEIKTGEIVVKDNLFERACQLTADCGALKIWGSAPDSHVFRDFLIAGNVFRDTLGWTYVSEKRGRWTGGPQSEVRGLGGFGLYVDHASGIHAYRNISYNNGYTGYMVYGVWRDGDLVYLNNVAANSLYGMVLGGGGQYDTHGSVNTQVLNNIMVGNEAYGMSLSYATGRYANTTIDHNLYHNNGWRTYENGGLWKAGAMVVRESGSWDPYPTLADVQANTPWERHGVAGDPAFWDYDPADHEPHDGSWPDFHLTAASTNALDKGTGALPASLAALLGAFGVYDFRRGTAFDLGRYEGGFVLLAEPSTRAVAPGGVAQYALRLYPADLPHTVRLAATSPSTELSVSLDPAVIGSDAVATLTVAVQHAGGMPLPGRLYDIPISATGGGFAHNPSVRLIVGGVRLYLPLVAR